MHSFIDSFISSIYIATLRGASISSASKMNSLHVLCTQALSPFIFPFRTFMQKASNHLLINQNSICNVPSICRKRINRSQQEGGDTHFIVEGHIQIIGPTSINMVASSQERNRRNCDVTFIDELVPLMQIPPRNLTSYIFCTIHRYSYYIYGTIDVICMQIKRNNCILMS